jgi:hypothetical protein
MKIKYISLALAFLLLFFSCVSDIDLSNISKEISLHPNLVVPIGEVNMNLGEILSNAVTPGDITYGVNDEINFMSLDTINFKIPEMISLDQSSSMLSQTINLPIFTKTSIPANSDLPTISSSGFLNLLFAKSPNRIDSIAIKSIVLSFQLDASSELMNLTPSNILINLSFPGGKVRKIDGSPSQNLFTPNSFGTSRDIVLTDVVLNTSGNQTAIPVKIDIASNSGSNSFTLSPGSNFKCKIALKELKYEVAYGYFIPTSVPKTTIQTNVDFDKNLPYGNLNFSNPQVDITTTSNIGEFLKFNVDYIKAFSVTNPSNPSIYGSFDGQKSISIQFDRKPVIAGDTIMKKFRTLDKNWGAIDQFFANSQKPDILEYTFSASIDSTLTKQSTTPGFITSDGKIDVYLKTTIPISFNKGSYFLYKDSTKNVIEAIANALDQYNLVDINYAALVLDITNGLPVKSILSIMFADSIGNEIPTNFEKNYTILSGKVDANGYVQPGNETKQTLIVSVTKDQLATLRNAKKVLYNFRVEGESINSSIHFTKNNTFNLKIGLYVKGDLNVSLGVKKK